MKRALAGVAVVGLCVVAAQARGGSDQSGSSVAPGQALASSWSDWSQRLKAAAPARAKADREQVAAADLDVVDAHWMALTMWGEARGSGEEGMRAVGHVIDNRRKSGHHGGFATDTVSQAWQFSCWNAGDPNLRAINNIDELPHTSREYRLWQAARRIADEILAGRSTDPTGGALFYHATYVEPRWSRGVEPVALIGNHLFFLTAR